MVPVSAKSGEQISLGEIAVVSLGEMGGNPQLLVDALVGSGTNAPTITNVIYTGDVRSAGIFSNGDISLGVGTGIILSSGSAAGIAGPNNSDNSTLNTGAGGDGDLSALAQGTTYDASILEFDFECASATVVSFQFVFASEEYNEYVNTAYNDVFGMFVNGVNVALIPTTTIAVSINNLNCGNPYVAGTGGPNCDLFINNDLDDGGGAINTQADGLTTVFTAVATVIPGVNHFKIAIADIGDASLDSWVMIKGESFVCGLQEINASLDIKPGSCPNPINYKDKGGVPVAILGSADLDVSTIDLSTVTLLGVSPTKNSISDVGTAYTGELVDCMSCDTLGADGYPDLVLHFDAQTLFAAFGETVHNECRTVTIEAMNIDGIRVYGSDVFRIMKK